MKNINTNAMCDWRELQKELNDNISDLSSSSQFYIKSTTPKEDFSNTNANKYTQSNYSTKQNEDQNFIIYQTFKNMLNKKSQNKKQDTITLNPDQPIQKFNDLKYNDNPFELNNKFQTTNTNVSHYNNTTEQIIIDNENSILNDISNIKIEGCSPGFNFIPNIVNSNINHNNVKQQQCIQQHINVNPMVEQSSTFTTTCFAEGNTQNSNNKKKENKNNKYKKNYFDLKHKYKKLKHNYIKLKKINESLVYKGTINDNNSKMIEKVNALLMQQIEENTLLFTELEEKLSQKEQIISQQILLLKQQKDIINKLSPNVNQFTSNELLDKTDPEIADVFTGSKII